MKISTAIALAMAVGGSLVIASGNGNSFVLMLTVVGWVWTIVAFMARG